MTCIVGIVHRDTVWIGGDSAGVGGWSLVSRADPKVFSAHGFIYGFTNSFRMGNLLRYRFKPPPCNNPEIDLMEYMATDYIDALRECFRAHCFGKIDNNSQTGGAFLVGTRGRLFEVCDDFQVGENRGGYASVGCGTDVAMGALYATKGMAPRPRARLALEAAEAGSIGVRGPFVVQRLRA